MASGHVRELSPTGRMVAVLCAVVIVLAALACTKVYTVLAAGAVADDDTPHSTTRRSLPDAGASCIAHFAPDAYDVPAMTPVVASIAQLYAT
jgi:hypothetical protein